MVPFRLFITLFLALFSIAAAEPEEQVSRDFAYVVFQKNTEAMKGDKTTFTKYEVFLPNQELGGSLQLWQHFTPKRKFYKRKISFPGHTSLEGFNGTYIWSRDFDTTIKMDINKTKIL